MTTDSERVARAFHERYEELAPSLGWETQERSRKEWDEVPPENKALMLAVAGSLIDQGVIVVPTVCVFCDIVHRRAPATYIREWEDAIAVRPLNPVVPDHVLVLPREHVTDARELPFVTAQTMYRAAQLARDCIDDLNIITSIGPNATQTVEHLHLHLVPRRAGDGLHLPWTGQER